MKINQLYTSFLLLLSMFFISCENESVKPSSQEISFSIDKNTVYLGDTLFLFGLDESNNSNLNLILRNSSNIDSIIKVSNSKLNIINFGLTGTYSIFIEDGNDTSAIKNIEFFNYPNFQTVIVQGGSFTRGYIWGLPDENLEKEIQIDHSLEVMVYELSEAEFNYIMNDSRFDFNGRKQ